MSAQIRFFNKNKIDLNNNLASITITDAVATNNGQTFVDFMRNRNQVSAWQTTGSTDAALTEILSDMSDEREIDSIIIAGHNFKAFTVKYWDGGAFVDFSTPISETVNTETTNFFSFTKVSTKQIKIIVQGTQVVDDDKKITQLILTDNLGSGQLEGWPIIRSPRHSTNKQISQMLSGKANVVESVGAFGMELDVKNWNIDADMSIIEDIYFGKRGVLVWLSGGDETQFSHLRVGYRKSDIYLMRAVNDYTPTWAAGVYTTGLQIKLKLQEAID